MKSLSQSQMKRLTAVHGWSGMLLGLLLYAVVITGTVVVFAEEIAVWSVGGNRATAPLTSELDSKVHAAAESVTKGYREAIDVWSNARGEVLIFAHAHARNPDTGQMDDIGPLIRVDAESGEVLSRNDGFVWQRADWYDPSALRHFLVDLHVQLSVPEPWGLILTGILGLAMMAAGVTGFIMHRHLLRDLFVAERPGKRLVSARDRHVLAASWGLPFAFLLGFTGAFFSFAGTVALPLLATIAFGGDQEALVETLYEPAVQTDPRPQPLANLDAMIAESTGRAGAAPIFVSIGNFGRADSRVSIWHEPPAGSLYYVHNLFDGTGRFLEKRPAIGNEPSTASFVYSLMGPLHFGNFAGILSKSVWVGLGAAMCFVILSGMQLWTRRREEERLWRGFARAVSVVGYGLPLAMLASAYAFFLSLPSADPFWWTPAGFLIAAALAIVFGCAVQDERRLTLGFRRSLAVGCLALPLLRMAAGGTSWAEALGHGLGTVLAIDLVLALLGAALLLWRVQESPRARNAAFRPLSEAAE